MKKLFSAANAIIAIGAGLLVLLGYFIPGLFGGIRATLVQWAVIMAAFALLLGVLNLISVHWKKINAEHAGVRALYSGVLLLSLTLTVILVGIDGPTGFWSVWAVNTFQVSVEASLLATMAVVLLFSVARLLGRRLHWSTFLFIGVVLVVILGSAPLYKVGDVQILSTLRSWLAQVPAVAVARGLLLGVALGTVATGLRILMGVDRPYGG